MRFLVWMLALLCAGLAGVATERASADDRDTHGRDAEPDYARVFPPDAVNRLDIRMAPADWQIVVADMQSMAGNSGFGLNVGFSSSQIAACGGRLQADACTASDPPVQGRCTQTGFPAGQLACVPIIGGPNNGGDETEILPRTPVYVPVDVTFDGETFRRVGFRLKGNSTLYFTWRRGSDKLPFRLNFDGLEARFPETRDQTFFGFTNLAFTNGNLDNTYLRGKVVTDLFREAGVPAARVEFMRVYLDRGTGSVVSRPVHDGRGAGSSDAPPAVRVGRRESLQAARRRRPVDRLRPRARSTSGRTRNDEDWTDIQGAIAALHGSKADRAAWRRRLEARFDVPCSSAGWRSTRSWATSTPTAACRRHNYYVYSSLRHRDRIFWIPWDHDLAMPTGGLGTPAPGTHHRSVP